MEEDLVSVVNSIGVSPLSVAEVIFSLSVTDGGWILDDYSTINISSGHRFRFHRKIPDFSIFLLYSYTVTDSLFSSVFFTCSAVSVRNKLRSLRSAQQSHSNIPVIPLVLLTQRV